MLKTLNAFVAATLLAGMASTALADSALDVKSPADPAAAGFKRITPQEIQGNTFKMIGSDWMLVSAGDEKNFNGMTAAWGGFGVWGKPVAFILVRNDRHTYEFLEKEAYFTLSFFDDAKYRGALQLFGTKSGRDMDKTKAAGLTAMPTKPGMAYAEAKLIIVCKKTFSDMTVKSGTGHKLYFGEIVAVWRKAEAAAK